MKQVFSWVFFTWIFGCLSSLNFLLSLFCKGFLQGYIGQVSPWSLCTGWGLCIGTANGNYWITDFWLGISKKVNNIISTSLKNTLFQKITGAWLEKWACHTDFEISGSKIEKGVAGSVFKPHPCNFWIWMIFYRFSNDISNIFLYLHCMDRTELRSSSEKISKFKRAWQVQISRYTHVTLRKYAFLKNNQMILVSFSCIFNTSLKITSVCSTNTLSSPCISHLGWN